MTVCANCGIPIRLSGFNGVPALSHKAWAHDDDFYPCRAWRGGRSWEQDWHRRATPKVEADLRQAVERAVRP